mgnify:CR=1 FL=1
MNQESRKFLIAQVEKTYQKQKDKLIPPVAPSLNNYLIAAVLDNSIEYVSIEILKETIRDMVLKFGAEDTLVQAESKWRRRGLGEKEVHTINLDPAKLFILPPAYLAALKDYEEKQQRYKDETEKLEEFRDMIVMKIQIGSNQVLDKLVAQVDNMADLQIMNKQLNITYSPTDGSIEGNRS